MLCIHSPSTSLFYKGVGGVRVHRIYLYFMSGVRMGRFLVFDLCVQSFNMAPQLCIMLVCCSIALVIHSV